KHLKGMMCGDYSKRDIDYTIKHIRHRGIQKARAMRVNVKMGEVNESQNWMYEDENEDVKDVLDTKGSAWPEGSIVGGEYMPYERVESGDNF
ncbi:cytoplasmic RNA-binding protein, partial [Ascosphaera pollenicola]